MTDHSGDGAPRPDVVAIGGGHGLALSLRAVRTFAATVTAVVSTADDGGSSGRLRAQLGMPAPGDLRRCLSAVAGDRALAEAFEHRFGRGDLGGHAVGNLLLAGLVDSGADLATAAVHLSRWLGVDPTVRILPATSDPVDLVAETADGPLRGQVQIEAGGALTRLAVEPADVETPPGVIEAIHGADVVVLGPGSFYTSVLAAALVPEVCSALTRSDGRLVFVANLRADESGVRGFDVARHVEVLRDHGIAPDVVVAQQGATPLGDLRGVHVVVADVDRPHGLAHDVDLLGAVLEEVSRSVL